MQIGPDIVDNPIAIEEKIRQNCLNDLKEVQPLIRENEALNDMLLDLQHKRREIIEAHLSSLKLPAEIEIMAKILDEEEEENFYLKKGSTEQRISIEVLNKVIENQLDSKTNLEKVKLSVPCFLILTY